MALLSLILKVLRGTFIYYILNVMSSFYHTNKGIGTMSVNASIDEFQINEINVDLRTSGFDNEVLSVDACAV